MGSIWSRRRSITSTATWDQNRCACNGAYNQLQLDIYGEVLDAAYLYNKHGAPISYDLWTSLRALTDWVRDNWHRKDEGV